MVGESEKYCLPANMAKLRLTLDLHFQQVVHLPPAVTPAGAVDRANEDSVAITFLREWARELTRSRAGSS